MKIIAMGLLLFLAACGGSAPDDEPPQRDRRFTAGGDRAVDR